MTVGGYESVISICNSSAAAAFRVPRRELRICDVAFLDGKLYALSPKKLFVVDVESSRGAREPKIPSMECIDDDVENPGVMYYKTIGDKSYTCVYWSYLVESRGKLLRVRRLVGHLSTLTEEADYMDRTRTFSFEMFEADLTKPRSCVQWRRDHHAFAARDYGGDAAK